MTMNNHSIENLDDEVMGISKNSIEGVCIVENRIIILLNASMLKPEIFKIDFERENVL